MKKFIGLFIFLAFLGSLAWAGPWGIVVNSQSMNINTIDLGQTPPKVYGPFLTGSLGTSGDSLLDVAITPDSNYALISNFAGQKVYRIDISDPTNPVLAGTITLSFYAEDIAISPNGQFAVVSDGGFSNNLAFINLSSFSNYSLYTIKSSNLYAQAVAIGNDNSTVIMPDYANSRIIYGRVNATFSGLVSENNLPADGNPINISISPDGTTVLTADFWGSSVGVFQITGPGIVVPGSTPKITGFHEYPQSIAFSPDGKKAYVVCAGSPVTFSWLQVNGPGNVTMGGERVTNLFSYSAAGYFGVDVLAVAPAGNYAIASSTAYISDPHTRASLINLGNYQATAIDATQDDATGVAIFNEMVFAPTNAGLERLTNNFIFYKEYINRLTWQANSKNKFPIAHYRIYRKAAGAADSTYMQAAEVAASTLQYDDRGLKKNDSYTYKITSLNDRGLESAGVEVSSVIVMRRVR
jgi:DNA-binding beta-propeller fold protein YncE